jgi:cell division protein FtsW
VPREDRTETLRRTARPDLPAAGQVLLLVTLGMTAFGQVMVYSASSPLALTQRQYNNDPLYFVKHGLLFTVAGVVLMLVVMRMHSGWLRRAAPTLLVGSLFLLVAVMVPGIGAMVNGARRWIIVGPITIQPSEVVKFALLAAVASLLAARRQPPGTLRELARPIGVITLIACVLVLAEPDLGSAIAIAMMVVAMLFVSGTPTRLLGVVCAGGVAAAGAAIAMAPYREQRLLAFLHPTRQASGAAYQIVQGMIAIGSGGVNGVGLGGSIQKVYYVPEAHTDMIFAIIGEELGLVGTLIVVVGFAAFAWAGFSIALAARDRFSQLIAAGATTLIAGQACVNVGAVMGILPLTGIPLPLISYGSSSKLVTLVIVGVLLAICRENAETATLRATAARDEPAEHQPPVAARRRAAAGRG